MPYASKEKRNAYRRANRNRFNKQTREWRLRHPEYKIRDKAWREKNRERILQYALAWKSQHPEQVRARDILKNAVRAGSVIRPASCSICGNTCKPDGHHYDYSKPLDVIWACRECHANLRSDA